MKKRAVHRRVVLVAAMAVIVFGLSTVFAGAADRNTDTNTPKAGNTIVVVPGNFQKANVNAVIDLINKYRKEACDNGYIDPRTLQPLKSSDYVPIKWSGDLEWIAQTRAAEGSVYQSHDRPNGEGCFSCTNNGVGTHAENLAWNYGSLIGGIEQWYDEKDDWVKQNAGAVTGHYTSMINPNYKYVGIGLFTSKSGDWSCVAGEFSMANSLDSTSKGVSGAYGQKMEVKTSSLSKPVIKGSASVVFGNKPKYSVERHVTYPHIWGGNLSTPIKVGTVKWSSLKTSIFKVNSSGTLATVKEGTADLKATLQDGGNTTKSVKILPPKKGKTFVAKNVTYKITVAKKEVAYQANKKAKGNVTVPNTVKYGGRTYKVTSIASSVFKGNKKIKSVTIGTNVRGIGKQAFFNCTALKKVIIKTKSLKATKVGAKAFSKTKVKTVKCPAGKSKAYKKILRKKGIGKKAVFK